MKDNKLRTLWAQDKAVVNGWLAIPNGFSLDSHLGNAWRMIRGGTSYDVELEFDSEFAETIAEERTVRHAAIREEKKPRRRRAAARNVS